MTLGTYGHPHCRAHNQRGEPCGAFPIRGGAVCVVHGGGAPQVRAAADRNIRQLYQTAIDALERAISDPDPQVRSSAVAAARLVVEYEHGKPKERVETVSMKEFTIRISRDDDGEET